MADSTIGWQALLIGASGAVGVKALDFIFSYLSRSSSVIEEQRTADVQQIRIFVSEISQISKEYWSAEGNAEGQEVREHSIIAKLSAIGDLVSTLAEGHPHQFSLIEEARRTFHERCTDGDFEVRSRPPQIFRCRDIETSGFRLAHAAERQRRTLRRWFWR